MKAFKATDAFAVEAYRLSRTVAGSAHAGLAGEIRRTAIRSGGALVAASANAPGGRAEQRLLERARTDLIEGRYYLYVARRVGLLDLRRYRGLTARQDAALNELDLLLRAGAPRPPRPPPPQG